MNSSAMVVARRIHRSNRGLVMTGGKDTRNRGGAPLTGRGNLLRYPPLGLHSTSTGGSDGSTNRWNRGRGNPGDGVGRRVWRRQGQEGGGRQRSGRRRRRRQARRCGRREAQGGRAGVGNALTSG